MDVYGKCMTTRTEQSFRKAGSDNMEEKIRVLLADDDSEFCARMAAALENAGDMELAGIAEDGGKALAAVGDCVRPLRRAGPWCSAACTRRSRKCR